MARTQQKMEITPDEERLLQNIVRKGSDWRERERARTILELAAGKKVSVIADELGIHQETVRVRRRKWKQEKLLSLHEKERSGAPRKLNQSHIVYLVSRIEQEPLETRQLLSEIDEKFGLKISRNTLANILKERGYVREKSQYRLKNKLTKMHGKHNT